MRMFFNEVFFFFLTINTVLIFERLVHACSQSQQSPLPSYSSSLYEFNFIF